MNEEVKKTALKLSDYTETINKTIRKRLFFLTIMCIYRNVSICND